jgi:dihydrofolate synthase / folylpolyglutamate synthase
MAPSLPPALAWLYSVQQFGMKPGLDNTRRLLKELQLPWNRQRFFHVAGTNGKGSTCAFLESILRFAGERTGLFTSPHLVSFSERIRTNGQLIPPDDLTRSIEALRPIVASWDPHPTFFELSLMLALDWFERSGAESIVLETGMGGRLDATNALTPIVSLITPIGMDHQQWLGNSLAAIASEKAGIIKPGIPVFSAPQAPEAAEVITHAAARANAPLTFVSQPYQGPLPLPGSHQAWNAALAIAAARSTGLHLSDDLIARALAATSWPARFQQLENGRLIIDGAHNPHGAAATTETWQLLFGSEPAAIVFGAVAPRETAEVLAALAPIAAAFFCVAPDSPRAIPAPESAAAAPTHIPASSHPNLPDALAAARASSRRILVCGSLYLCGETLSLLNGIPFEPSSQ